MNAHEQVVFKLPRVDVRLQTEGGTTVKCVCEVVLTNQNIRLNATNKDGVTYTVKNRGDREFHSLVVPLPIATPHRFVQPWIGPYKWETRFTTNELIPTDESWTMQLTFNEGGAIEYREHFLKVFHECRQARENGMDELLPAYSE